MRSLILLFVLSFTLLGCKTYSDDEVNEFDKEIKEYIEKKDLTLERSSSGLYYTILEQGDGDKVQFKDLVSFKYKGEFLDGEVFDEQKEPIEFQVEVLIAAWQEIMMELNVGGKAFIISPPTLGYGATELDAIPPNSILVYNLEVVGIK